MVTAATTTTTVLNRNSVTIWKKKKKRKRKTRGNRGTGSYGTCGSSVSFVRVIATAKPQIRTRGERRGGRRDIPRCRSRFWLATPTSPTIAGGWLPGGERDPSHLENNSIRLYRGLCKRMTRVSHEGGRATSLLNGRPWWCDDGVVTMVVVRPNHFATSNPIVTLPAALLINFI